MLNNFRDWFWKDSFWLPYGFKWEDVKNCPLSSLYVAPFVTVFILLFRHFFERYVAINFCIYIGIIGSPTTTETTSSETELCETEKPKFRKNKRYQQVQQFQKATETCWRCFAYFILFVYGSFVIFRSGWFWNTESWLIDYIVNQPFPDQLRWYYIAELSFYMALLLTHFNDTKRKDFFQQFVHHVLTIILITGSYLIAHFRYGSVIMLLHDASDYWLEAAKLAKYAKKQRICDALFVVFALVFYLSRWVYFPFWVMLPWTRDNARLAGPMQSYFTFPYIFLYLCFMLLGLHIYWGILIARMVYNFTRTGTVDKDDRSDEDS